MHFRLSLGVQIFNSDLCVSGCQAMPYALHPGADHLNKMIRNKCTMMPKNVSQVKIDCRIFAQPHPSTVALAPECNQMKFTWKVEKRNSILKMQLRCDAGKVHSYLYKCRSWPRIGRMSCGSARASFGGEGKNETVSGKGDDGASGGGAK